MNKIIKSVFIISLFFIGYTSLKAQPGDPNGGGDLDNDNPVPITGIEYLIAAGAAFGAKKLYDKKKN